MSQRTRMITATKGKRLFSPGQPCPGFLSLSRGMLRVSLAADNGREVVLYRVGPGDICLQTFSCLINNSSYGAEGVAETDLEGTILPPEEFHRRLAGDTEFRTQVFAAVARRFADFERLVEDVALMGLDVRLARALLRLRTGNRVPHTHEQLASEVASGRAVVSRQLAEFARTGLVSPGRGAIELVDAEGLERIAAGRE